jgi:hypothetical protein
MLLVNNELRTRIKLPESASLGDADWRVSFGMGEPTPRIVPSPQFLLFSAHSGYLQYHSIQDPAFRVFLKALFELTKEPNPFNRPTDHALNAALELTWGARSLLGARGWTTPDVDTDTDGGVRLTWNRGEREVVAVLPKNSDLQRYLFYSDRDGRGAITNFETGSLADRLNWVVTPHAAGL